MIPNNFKPVSWSEVEVGDIVYLAIKTNDKWYVCGQDGKYKVDNKNMKRLRNGDSKYTFTFDGFLLRKD